MARLKTFSTTTYYGDDYLFAKAAVCTLMVGVVTLVVLLLGSTISAHGRALSKPAVSNGFGAGLLHGVVTDSSTTSLLRNTTETVQARVSTKTPRTTPASRRDDKAVKSGLASRLLRESLDDSADPCRDLRAHVCTGYNQGELGGRPLEERAAQDVADAVEAAFRDAVGSTSGLVEKHSSLRKAAAYYWSCMDADPENPLNVKALADFFEHNDLSLSSDSDNGGSAASPDFLDKAVELHLRYDLRLFFELRADAFPDRGVRSLRVVADSDFEEWKEKRLAMRNRKEHGPLVQNALESCGVSKKRAPELARRIWTLEDKLLVKSGSEVQDYDDSIEESWKTSLEAHSGGAFMADFELDLGSDAATSLNDMRSRQGVSDAGRALYVAWEACRRLVNASTPAPRKSSRCVALTSVDYGHVVRAPYYFSALTAAKLAKVKTMIGGIVHEFVASIDGTRWLPLGIREELKNRVRRVRWMLGYAPRLDQWTGLDRFYKGYPTATGVFAADYLTARQERMRRFLESLHDGHDVHTRFAYVEQPQSEPTYVASQNRVALPAASMLPPMFDERSLPAVNYGLLGSVLLRAMARVAIDVAEIKHEEAERVAWSGRTVKQFVERLTCRQMSAGVENDAPRLPSVSVGGHALLRAFRDAAAHDVRRRSLPTAERKRRSRLFFLSRCLLFCADDHSTASNSANHRCNVMAHRSSEFAEAFGCPGWRNRTRDRCDVW